MNPKYIKSETVCLVRFTQPPPITSARYTILQISAYGFMFVIMTPGSEAYRLKLLAAAVYRMHIYGLLTDTVNMHVENILHKLKKPRPLWKKPLSWLARCLIY